MSCKVCGTDPGGAEVCPVCGWLQVDVPTVDWAGVRPVPTLAGYLTGGSGYLAGAAIIAAITVLVGVAVVATAGAATLTFVVPSVVVLTAGAVALTRRMQRIAIDLANTQAVAGYRAALAARYAEIEANKARLLAWHRQQLHAQITAATVDVAATAGAGTSTDPSAPLERTFGDFALVDAAGIAGVGVAELMWTWARIDPEVVRAVAFASPNAHIHNAFGFVRMINSSYSQLSPAGQNAAFTRLVGYVGEQRYYHLATQGGHVVTQAMTSNQPVWDFLVDGHPVNVKTYAKVTSALRNVAARHPDVRFAIPDDAQVQGHLAANIERVAGLSHRDATQQLRHAVQSAQGDTASRQLAHLLPVITVGVAAYRAAARIRAGEQVKSAIAYTAVDTIGRAGGAALGSKAGAVLGTSVAGPVGGFVGGLVGGAGGAIIGGVVVDQVKQVHFERTQTALHDSLAAYWQTCDRRESLRGRIDADLAERDRVAGHLHELADQVRASDRWRIWPSETDMLTVVTANYATTAARTGRIEAAPLLELLDHADTDPGTDPDTDVDDARARLGTMLANTPELAELVGARPDQLTRVRDARRTALEVREGLYPGTTPFASPAAVQRAAERSVKVLTLAGHDWFHAADCATTPCTTLAADLDAAGRYRAWRNARTMNADVDTSVLDMDSFRKRRIKPCPDCEPRIVAAVDDYLTTSSPRPGWHVEAGTDHWWCDAHHRTTCTDCAPGDT